MKQKIAAVAFVFCALSSFAHAQVRAGTVEISPSVGYLFGGDFPRGSNALFTNRVDVDDHLTYGVGIGYFLTSSTEFEARWARTETQFVNHRSNQVFGPDQDQKLADLTIDYFMGYGTFHFGHRRAVPYVTVSLGAARLDPGRLTAAGCPTAPCPVPSTSTRFTAALGGGVKIYANPHFGFRFDGRYYGTYLNSRDRCDVFSDGRTFCSNSDRTNWLGNLETTGGLVISF